MNTIRRKAPKSFQTERLCLRAPLKEGDGLIIHQAIIASIQELKPWLPFVQNTPTKDETERSWQTAYQKFIEKDYFRYLIFTKERNEFIGVASFENLDWHIPKCEIGYWINTKYSGNGYMTETVQELITIGINQMKFNRIDIRCESTNVKRRAIPEKLELNLEGILKNEDRAADGSKLTDTCIYSITP
ncbi:GNAT family N-acetyltransferase [Alkalihalophilus marmarensis]|uniref:GNAT family N-acetyltransferase n=1 Tax=Alkalihalophilus marmarensis TaxID=521377 RepID=UPI002E1CFBFD|nr:GNAT family N-acetyltransferase [Alkalihalophilus marmarensis]